jgi:hypothetical protein
LRAFIAAPHCGTDLVVAQECQKGIVKLQIAAARPRKIGDFLSTGARQFGEEMVAFWISFRSIILSPPCTIIMDGGWNTDLGRPAI